MTTKNQNFEIAAGSNKTLEFSVVDEAGAPLDLTGASAEWSLLDPETYSVVLQHTTAGSIVIPTPTNGVVQVPLSPADTVDLAGDFDHQLRIIDVAGNTTPVTVGTGTIRKAA